MNVGSKIYVWSYGAHEAVVFQVKRFEVLKMVNIPSGEIKAEGIPHVSQTKTVDVILSVNGVMYPLDLFDHWAYTMDELLKIVHNSPTTPKAESQVLGLGATYEAAYKEAFNLLVEVLTARGLQFSPELHERVAAFVHNRIGPLQ